MKEFEYPSLGGGTIHAYRWEPAGEPVAVVQIIHGIAEHMLRYDDFARFLNSHGVLVVAEDHMGHGKSTVAVSVSMSSSCMPTPSSVVGMPMDS